MQAMPVPGGGRQRTAEATIRQPTSGAMLLPPVTYPVRAAPQWTLRPLKRSLACAFAMLPYHPPLPTRLIQIKYPIACIRENRSQRK